MLFDGVNGWGCYLLLVLLGIEMGFLNCSKKNFCEEMEGMVNYEVE